MAVIENDIRHHDKRLNDGDSNFKVLDQKIDGLRQTFDNHFDGLSSSVNQLIGEIRAGRRFAEKTVSEKSEAFYCTQEDIE